MATQSQKDFFQKLVDERQFPDGKSPESLVNEFGVLNQKSASAWIERAISLPKRDESMEEMVPAPF